MFIGEYKTSVTEGRRVAIPKKFREQLNKQGVIVTRGYEGCIVMIGASEFEKLLEGVADVPFISADKRETSRFLLSGAHDVEPDSQGRIIIPESLREHAGINGTEVSFLGVGNWIEIWDESKWKEYQKGLDGQSQEIADRLLGIAPKQLSD